jgi:hypothetical protein
MEGLHLEASEAAIGVVQLLLLVSAGWSVCASQARSFTVRFQPRAASAAAARFPAFGIRPRAVFCKVAANQQHNKRPLG